MNWLTRPWLRLFRADPWVIVALAVLSFVVALVAAAAPRAMSAVADRQLEQSVDSLASWQREPLAVWNDEEYPLEWSSGEVPDPAAAITEGAERIREAQPQPLRGLLAEARLVRRSVTNTPYVPDFNVSDLALARIHTLINPTLTTDMTIVEGDWPEHSAEPPFELALAVEAAERLGVSVGDTFGNEDEFLLAATVAPANPADPRWETLDTGDRFHVEQDPNTGNIATITAYLAPDFRGSISPNAPTGYVNSLWYPVDVAALTDNVDVPALQAQLTRMLASGHVLVEEHDPVYGRAVEVHFESELGGTLERVVREQQEATTLVAIVAAGPVGVAAAVVALGAALAVVRRRPTLELMTARGASPEQLRTMIGLEGAVLTLPAAAAGHLIALAVPGHSPWWTWLATILIGLVPAGALMLAVRDLSARTRRDISARGSRVRLTAEIGFLLITAAATWQLLSRAETGDGVDLLAVATPILLAFSAVLLTLHFYPLPLAALAAAFKRGRSLVPHLGAARALRDPAGGLVPTLAIVLGVSVAMLSTVMLGTVTQGAEAAVWNDNGASARLTGRITDEVLDAVLAVDGVAAAGRLAQTTGEVPLHVGEETEQVRVWVVGESMADVWAETPFIQAPPPELFTPGTIVTGGDVQAGSGTVTLGGVGEAAVVGHLDDLPGTVTTNRWALVPASTWANAGMEHPLSSIIYLRAEDGADLERVTDDVQALVPHSRVTTVAGGLERNAENVVLQALGLTFVAAAAGTAALTALALVVVQFMGARSRAELLAVLRTQGMRRGQARGLVAWELGPIAVTAIIVGAGLGIGIAWLLAGTLDLSGLTGSTAAPDLYLDPAVLGLVLLAVVATVAIAVLVSAWLAGRTNLAQALRIGEDR